LSTGPKPVASVIWLHGLGADGHDFKPIVPELAHFLRPATRFIFPHAEVRPVTVNGGYPMRAWYDIYSFENRDRQDETGIKSSDAIVRALIARENSRGIPNERIVLAGFSQGGAMALHTGTRLMPPLAGIMALSCYLILPARLLAERAAATMATPVFQAHGESDNVLPLALGESARDQLQSAGYQVEWHQYPMAHSVSQEEIADIGHWLAARF
jgi:phospholipase/carboxylesterase